jgi:protein tyrosine phosphatase (PTP) superfamily phosphohydrolase (DUF442 family)
MRLIKTTRATWIIVILVPASLWAPLMCSTVTGPASAVEQGRFYRSGQMTPGELRAFIRKQGVRTVINLRGCHPEEEWYRGEIAVCASLAVKHYDLMWSKDHLPTPESLGQFLDFCKKSPGPILTHCQGGTHRSGLAAAVFLLAQGRGADEARKQLGLFFGEAPIGRVITLYEGSPLSFEEWVKSVYPKLYAEIEGEAAEAAK